ncbi:MAG: ExbD/TolR family protein [Kiritimatiellia bacterium]
MKLKRRAEVQMDVDMTPMIDMVFLLLVFFMTAATMAKMNMTEKVKLPVAEKAQIPDNKQDREPITVMPDGFAVSDGSVISASAPYMFRGKKLDATGLSQALTAVVKDDPKLRVFMRIDRNVEYIRVQSAIRACAEAGIYDIIFGAYQTSAGD